MTPFEFLTYLSQPIFSTPW